MKTRSILSAFAGLFCFVGLAFGEITTKQVDDAFRAKQEAAMTLAMATANEQEDTSKEEEAVKKADTAYAEIHKAYVTQVMKPKEEPEAEPEDSGTEG